MNLLTDWIPEQWLYALGWTLVHSLWQLFVIGVILWIGLKISNNKSASLKYNLGLLALGLGFLLTVGTFIYELSSFAPGLDLEVWLKGMALAESKDIASTSVVEGFLLQAVSWIDQQLPLLVNFWFFGALLFLFRLFTSLSELRMLRKSQAVEVDFQVEKMFYRLVGKFGLDAKVRLKVTETGVAPITFGYLKPIVLIPAALVFHLSPSQLEAILAHELAHVKRNDYLVNFVQSAMEVLFFYHPSYWWMSQTIKELRENAADDLAVQVGIAPKELAFSLAEVLNLATPTPPELALPASKKRNPTLQRIKRILGHPAQNYPQNPILSIPMLLTLLFSAGLIASAQQDSPLAIEAIQPTVYLDSPEVENFKNNLLILPAIDTVEDVVTIQKAERPGDKPMVWVTDSGEKIIIRSNGKNSYRISGDTVLAKGDTIFLKGNKSYIFKSGEGVDWSTMPKMDFAFPEPPIGPDFGSAPMPKLALSEMPVMPPMTPMLAMPTMPEMGDFEFFKSGTKGVFIHRDTTNMSKAEKEKWAKEMELKANEWAKRSEEMMKEWEPQMKVWEEKMEAWQKANEPKMKEYEEKMKAWEKANEPKMKEFEEKMKAWEKANEPKMKEFEKKMEEWQKKFQPKMEEFQRKMEIWQEENAEKMDEFHRKLEEQLKKKDNSNTTVSKSSSSRI